MKQATQWRNNSGYDTLTTDNEGYSPLLETGFVLLLETDFSMLLEDAVATPKSPATWSTVDKTRTSWEARDGYSGVTVGIGDIRTTAMGDTRITESGDTRITDLATFSEKPRTAWSEA